MATCENTPACLQRVETQNGRQVVLTESAQDVSVTTVAIGRFGMRLVVAGRRDGGNDPVCVTTGCVCGQVTARMQRGFSFRVFLVDGCPS
jgi:hypothetical protein